MSDDMAQRDAIFDTSDDVQEIVELDLSRVRPDPNQPRQMFDEEDLEELASSIKEHGQLVPILVRPDTAGERSYVIIGGERRFRASERLGRDRIQAIILRVDEKKARELALVDNLQRVDLSPFEEAAGYARLIEEFSYTQEQVAERVGKSRTSVTGALALNRLPARVREEARAAKVSKSKLIELAQLGDEGRQLILWERLKKGVTVQEARQAKQQVGGKPRLDKKPSSDVPRVISAGRDFAKRLERVDVSYLKAKPREYERLVEIHSRIGRFLEESGQAVEQKMEADQAEDVQAMAS